MILKDKLSSFKSIEEVLMILPVQDATVATFAILVLKGLS